MPRDLPITADPGVSVQNHVYVFLRERDPGGRESPGETLRVMRGPHIAREAVGHRD